MKSEALYENVVTFLFREYRGQSNIYACAGPDACASAGAGADAGGNGW